MLSITMRTVMLQARSFHKTALKPTFTDAAVADTKSPATPDDTSARAAWQRYRDIEAHQIWLSSPRKESFQTKLSFKETRDPTPTPAMTFCMDREMHIAARQASSNQTERSQQSENPECNFMKTWLSVRWWSRG